MIRAEAVMGAPGYYVSECGRVFSINRRADGSRLQEMRLVPNTHGYPAVKMTVGEKSITRAVHVLVAEAWHGRRPEGMEVRHLDGNKLNNQRSNLRWGTKSENCRDTVDHGRVYTQKLDREDVINIRELIEAGKHKMPEIGRMFGVTDATIYHIKNRRTWKHV